MAAPGSSGTAKGCTALQGEGAASEGVSSHTPRASTPSSRDTKLAGRASRLQVAGFAPSEYAGAAALDIVAAALHVITGHMELTGGRQPNPNPAPNLGPGPLAPSIYPTLNRTPTSTSEPSASSSPQPSRPRPLTLTRATSGESGVDFFDPEMLAERTANLKCPVDPSKVKYMKTSYTNCGIRNTLTR